MKNDRLLIVVIFLVFIYFLIYSLPNYSSSYNKLLSESFDEKITVSLSPSSNLEWRNYLSFYFAEHYKYKTDDNVSLSIAYDFNKSSSDGIYSLDSNYYSSFYGVYVLEYNEKDYFYDSNGHIDYNKLIDIPSYDYKNVVLYSLECPMQERIFDVYEIDEYKNKVSMSSINNMTRYDASIKASGLWHKADAIKPAYLEFGIPKKSSSLDDFEEIDLYGRFYMKDYPNDKYAVFLYILSPSLDLIDKTDDQILSNLIIEIK